LRARSLYSSRVSVRRKDPASARHVSARPVAASRVRTLLEPPADPFGERRQPPVRVRAQVLGGEFRFECDDPALLPIVQAAYAKLPPHRFAAPAPRFVVRLALLRAPRTVRAVNDEPASVTALAGGGILCGAVGDSSFVALDPARRSALVVVSRAMLQFPYHVRYELLEFAVFTLAVRAQRLVPLHAACVGLGGAGILILGPSGSGKSTVTLHCLLAGLDFLAEDSVMVKPDGLLATGVANFLHVRRDSLRFLTHLADAARIRSSSIIRRRSGVEKLEIDLRSAGHRLARAPLKISAIVFVTAKRATGQRLVAPVSEADLVRRLAASQRYAAGQPGWSSFTRQVRRLPAYELRRGRHPAEAVEALRQVLRNAKS